MPTPEIPGQHLPYDPSDPQSILVHGRKVIGLTARRICALAGRPDPSTRADWRPTKNALGDVMEAYFGLTKNNRPEPDFPRAGVELKILPLKRKGSGLVVKEPTSISMIDYMVLPKERWDGPASVRKKLDRILFVFFVIEEDLMESTVKDVILWEPGDVEKELFHLDWERTRQMVHDGKAHLLSEAQAEALAARRKGPGGPADLGRPQPYSRERAPSRAWALKTTFTQQLFEERVLRKQFESAFASILPNIRMRGLRLAEERILTPLRKDVGESLASLASRMGAPLGAGKNLAATIIKRSLGFKSVNSKIREFEQLGIQVKTLHLRNKDGRPFESVSFPAVDLRALSVQDWDGFESEDGRPTRERSELIDQVQRILFVPTYSDNKDDPQEERRLGNAFFWSPSEEQWRTIEREWRMFQREVVEGRAQYDKPCGERGRRNRLSHSDQTTIIHMRPHGRNACDEDVDPRGNRVTRQSFWLNSDFVWRLVKENGAFPPPAARD